ncbi:HAD domain-containing protein [Streptomyces sp. NPDC004111]|uniref:HAD domain-containing protein n=1 Tax=Streptomyces sp. NPDC004111 TaxID=3364690 RepID=UPI0036C72C0C
MTTAPPPPAAEPAPALPPLLFLDVDGPLIPFGASRDQLPEGYPTYRSPHAAPASADANPLLPRLDPALGPRLLALPCELVWATTWLHEANACVSPWLGLPRLPVVEWPDPSPESAAADTRAGVHWKTRALTRWAARRPFAWADDEIGAADRQWVAAHHPAPALLLHVDARLGLTEDDFGTLEEWLRDVGNGAARR